MGECSSPLWSVSKIQQRGKTMTAGNTPVKITFTLGVSKETFKEHPILGLWECRTCFLTPLEHPPPQHTAPATQTECFSLLILSIQSRGLCRCLSLPFKHHCLLPAPSTGAKKSQPQTQVWPSWAARTFPCRACAHTARAQHPSRAAVSLSEVTQAQKGCPPPSLPPVPIY